MPPINLLHDPLCPADCVSNGTHRGSNSCSALDATMGSRKLFANDVEIVFLFNCLLQHFGPFSIVLLR
jgi:hypothetical protein